MVAGGGCILMVPDATPQTLGSGTVVHLSGHECDAVREDDPDLIFERFSNEHRRQVFR